MPHQPPPRPEHQEPAGPDSSQSTRKPRTKGPALTAQHVANKRFTPTRLREGYDQGKVDQFLDTVEQTLEAFEKGVAGTRRRGWLVTAQEVGDMGFTPVRLRAGYDMGEVDQFLHQVETAIGQWEASHS